MPPIGRLRKGELVDYFGEFSVPTNFPTNRMTIADLKSAI